MDRDEQFQKMVEENRQQYQRGIKLLAELIYKMVHENEVSSLSFVAQESPAVIKNEEIPG